jgi:hypothetical protein
MNQRDTISRMLEEDPSLRQRKNRYILAARMTGYDPEECKRICSIMDEYRHQTQADDTGLLLEREWHESPALKSDESCRLFQLRNITS